jgi:hypothetical protein
VIKFLGRPATIVQSHSLRTETQKVCEIFDLDYKPTWLVTREYLVAFSRRESPVILVTNLFIYNATLFQFFVSKHRIHVVFCCVLYFLAIQEKNIDAHKIVFK